MWRIIITIIGLVTMIITSCEKQTRGIKEADLGLIKDKVLATEDAYVAAEVNRDEKALNMLLDQHFVYNSADGTTTGKQEFINSVLDMNMVDQIISERSVMIEGNVGIIFGTTELIFQDPGKEQLRSKLRYTSVYVKRIEQWRMLALQMQSHKNK